MAHLLSQVDVTASPKGDQPVVATAGSARKRKNVDREAAAAVVDAGAAAASGDDSDMCVSLYFPALSNAARCQFLSLFCGLCFVGFRCRRVWLWPMLSYRCTVLCPLTRTVRWRDVRSVATRADLLPLWSSLRRSKVLPFYSDKAGANFREFSNFYSHTGFAFDIPPSVWREGYPKSVEVRFSEKAIMLCKAVLFDDREMFDQMVLSTRPAQVGRIALAGNGRVVADASFESGVRVFLSVFVPSVAHLPRCGSESTVNCLSALRPLGHLSSLEPPLESLQVKQLGRGVRNFNDAVWQANLMRIAEEVVTQKFQKVPGLSEVLLRTGGNLIAEAAPRDAIWGIGLGKADPLAMDPTQWRGTNVLGWALMRARGSLGGTGVPTPRK